MTGTRDVRVFHDPPKLGREIVRGFARPSGRPTQLPSVEYVRHGQRMDPDALAEYQRVCGVAVGANVPAPFVHVQAFGLATALMARPDFPVPVLGLIHMAHRFRVSRPLDVGEPLDLRVWAADLREHPAGRQVDLCAEASVDGEVVWSEVSTYLHRTKPPADRTPRPPIKPAPITAVWRLPADLGRRYAAVSGDRNPIHLSRLSARALGFPRAIAHGMWLDARVLAALAPRLPGRFTSEMTFKTPVLLPSAVAFDHRREPGGAWTVGVRSARSGRPHLSGTITSGTIA